MSKEEIIIAQNGAGNSAATSEIVHRSMDIEKAEFYIIIILTILLLMVAYFFWKRCKQGYGTYIRRELHEMPVITTRGERGLQGFATQQVIV